MLFSRYAFPSLMLVAFVIAAGCGGRSVGPALPTVTPTPAIGATTVVVGTSPEFVDLGDGSGNSAGFTFPQASIGGSAHMTIAMSTTLPGDAFAPMSRSHALAPTKPADIGGTLTVVDYITVVVDNAIGVSSSPSITFSLGGSTSIGAGLNTYLLMWDPATAAQQGWTVLDGPGTVSGASRNQVTFTSRQSGQAFNAGAQYIYALVTTTQQVAVAAPQPAPSVLPTPLYCANYANPSPNPARANGATIYITDDSALGVPLIVYVIRKAGAQNPAPAAWLDANQNFTSSVPVPLPAACFSTTLNSSSTVKLVTPDDMDGGRWYFVYATPVPGHPEQVPNPLSALRPGAEPGYSYSEAPYPFDAVEGGTTNNDALIIDTTQVDALGLPMDLSVDRASAPLPIRAACGGTNLVVGISSCHFKQIFDKMRQDPVYGNLVIAQPFNGKNYDLRILSPQKAPGQSAFQWNVFGDSSGVPEPLPSACTGAPKTYGYLSCILSDYKTTPRMYTANRTVIAGTYGSGDIYCVSSDGTENFIMTDVGPGPPPDAKPVPLSPPMCPAGPATPTPALNRPGAPVNPFIMPVEEFLYGIPPDSDGGGGCKMALLFSQPWGLRNVDNNAAHDPTPDPNGTPTPNPGPQTGHIFHTDDAFALWKAMEAEILYGTALSKDEHPVGYFYEKTLGKKLLPPSFSPLYADTMFDRYALILHNGFDNNRSYALAYDDLFDLAPTLLYHNSHAISVRINPVPEAEVPSNPNPVPPPLPPCTKIPQGVGATPYP